MRSLVFDAGPVISLTSSNLLWLIDKLKIRFKGEFYIPSGVKKELVDKPLQTKRFKFEALQVMKYIKYGALKLVQDNQVEKMAGELVSLANSCFEARGKSIHVISSAEMQVLACAAIYNSEAAVVDERTTRKLLEDPNELKKILEHKLHTKVKVNRKVIKKFQEKVKGVKIIRSFELVLIAFELGLLDMYAPEIKDSRRQLLSSVLWDVKLNGCAVSPRDIERAIKIELKND